MPQVLSYNQELTLVPKAMQANKMDSLTGIQNEGMSMSKVDCFFVWKQRWQPSKMENNQPAASQGSGKRKRHQASKLGMSTSKVECFFGLKMKAVIVKLKWRRWRQPSRSENNQPAMSKGSRKQKTKTPSCRCRRLIVVECYLFSRLFAWVKWTQKTLWRKRRVDWWVRNIAQPS